MYVCLCDVHTFVHHCHGETALASPQLASTFSPFFYLVLELSGCFLCPLRCLCICVSSRFRFDSSKNYNFTTTCKEYTRMYITAWMCVFVCVSQVDGKEVRQGVCRVAIVVAAAVAAAKCNRGSVVASYSSVWFLIFSFVDFIMYCNIAVAPNSWVWPLSLSLSQCGCSHLSASLLSVCRSHYRVSLCYMRAMIIDKITLLPSIRLSCWLCHTVCNCCAFYTYVSFTYSSLRAIFALLF